MNQRPRSSRMPGSEIGTALVHSFSTKQTIVFVVLSVLLVASAISMLASINRAFMIYEPERGGSLSEGIVGTPRFINPVLAISEADRDLVEIVYAGLMKKLPDGTLVPDMAESYTVSDDGLTYEFVIRDNAIFHDKTPLTAADVVFTIETIKDPLVKSPLAAAWNGVAVSANESSQNTVTFRLSEAYASFLENATVGILPSHIWAAKQPETFTLADENLYAVGSGPFRIKDIDEKKNNTIEDIRLRAFTQYAGERALISRLNLSFYKNEDDAIKAFRRGHIDQLGSVSPNAAHELADAGFSPHVATLSRVFGIFFNPNQNELLRDKEIVKAFDLAINEEAIIDEVLHGFGVPLNGPVPAPLSAYDHEAHNQATDTAEANKILDERGWQKNESGTRMKDGKTLQFSISTADVAELRHTAELIKRDLETIGAIVTVKVFETGVLNQNIIRPREYEALLFGQVIRNASDLFAFWHSSQRNDPGLNVAVYTNSSVDTMLEKLVGSSDPEFIAQTIKNFSAEIVRDRPAIFLYSPEFIYLRSDAAEGIDFDHLTSSSERFLGITEWYVRTDAIWKFMRKSENEMQP